MIIVVPCVVVRSCQDDETVGHLFLTCPFAQACWSSIGLQVIPGSDLFAALEALNLQIARPFFMEILIIMLWSIWTSRNNLFFFKSFKE